MVKIKKIASLFFLILFISYYAGTTLFSHVHIISGATIFHSHFHTDSHHNTKSGGHTEHCITLIAYTSHFEYIDFLCYEIPKPSQFLIHENKSIEFQQWFSSIHLENLALRAPPIV